MQADTEAPGATTEVVGVTRSTSPWNDMIASRGERKRTMILQWGREMGRGFQCPVSRGVEEKGMAEGRRHGCSMSHMECGRRGRRRGRMGYKRSGAEGWRYTFLSLLAVNKCSICSYQLKI